MVRDLIVDKTKVTDKVSRILARQRAFDLNLDEIKAPVDAGDVYKRQAVDRAKRVFKVLDHSCIYLFIAGSYTPFCLISLADSGGVWLCAFVWLVALAGVACEAFWVCLLYTSS